MINPGDIVLVKFPFAEGKGYKWRPALVVSGASLHKAFGICWVAMITSGENTPWPEDVTITPLAPTGLDSPCVVRPAKITATQIDEAAKIGKAPAAVLQKTLRFIRAQL